MWAVVTATKVAGQSGQQANTMCSVSHKFTIILAEKTASALPLAIGSASAQ